MGADDVAHHELRHSHADSECLGFVAAGNHAAVSVGKHNNRKAIQPGIEHPLTACVEFIAINQGKNRRGKRKAARPGFILADSPCFPGAGG
jgi:hypothetical protein